MLCCPPGDLPNPGIEPRSPTLQVDSVPPEPPGKPICIFIYLSNYLIFIHSFTDEHWAQVVHIFCGYCVLCCNKEPVGCCPRGREELDMTERLHFRFSLSCIGDGNGNPLQCSCLENPRDGGAWWAAVYVAQSQTRLK